LLVWTSLLEQVFTCAPSIVAGFSYAAFHLAIPISPDRPEPNMILQGEGVLILMSSVCTKGQYTTAWPVDNLTVSGLAANNNHNGIAPLHTLPSPGVCFLFRTGHSSGVASAFVTAPLCTPRNPLA